MQETGLQLTSWILRELHKFDQIQADQEKKSFVQLINFCPPAPWPTECFPS